MKFRPMHDRIVIKPIDAEAKTASGIITPDNAKEKPQRGEVVATGPGRLRDDVYPISGRPIVSARNVSKYYFKE